MRLGGGKDCNAATIRIGYEILVYDNAHLLKAKALDKYEHLDLSGNPQPNSKPRKKRLLKK